MSRAVTALLILNVAVFAVGLLVPSWHELIETGGAFWFPDNPNFKVWQVVTYLFLHGNFSHIFFNMFALYSFGTVLEWEWGAARFLIFYFLCGIGAGLIQTGINWHEFGVIHERLVAAGMTSDQLNTLLTTESGLLPANPAVKAMVFDLFRIYAPPMLGASGAIYGLMVAFGFLHPNAKLSLMFLPVPIAAKYFIPIIVGLDLFSGVTGFSIFGAGIAHFAHVGGAVIGFLLMLLWRKRGRIPAGPGAIAPSPTS